MSTAVKNTRPEPNGNVVKQVSDGLLSRVEGIRELLPPVLKHQADWFVKRALMTFSQSDQLRKCSASSFITAVLKGAEIGLPIDGKLGYAVSYFNSKKGELEAQFQPSYMGLVVVAKRSGQIINCYSGMIYEHDHFTHARHGDKCQLDHTWDFGQDRGAPLGAYAVVTLPGGEWTYDLMSLADLDAIRNRSKASGSGPWVTDTDEMRKKTVLRRALKLYCNDPGFVQAAELDDQQYETQDRTPAKRIQRSSLNDHLDLSTPVHAKQVPAERIEHTPEEHPESRPEPSVTPDDIVSDIKQSLADGDAASIRIAIDQATGPDSLLTQEGMDIVSSVGRDALAKLAAKSKGQKNLMDTHPNT